MKFIKDNSYDIVRLFINQIGITIFSLVLYTAAGFVEDDALGSTIRLWLSVFATLFYFSLIYIVAWECGAQDSLKIANKRIERNPFKGFLMALTANAPNLFLAAVAVVCMIIYICSGSEVAYSIFGILNLVIRFILAMFLGIIQGIFSSFSGDVTSYYLWQTVGFFVAPLLSVAVTHLGYSLGLRELKLRTFIAGGFKKQS